MWFSSPSVRAKAFADLLPLFVKSVPVYLVMYGIPTLAYGTLVWFALRAVGQLNLLALVIAGLLPVVGYWAWSLVTGGWETRALWALCTFAVPALAISVALWWFTTWGRFDA
jgi:hypothetical protein